MDGYHLILLGFVLVNYSILTVFVTQQVFVLALPWKHTDIADGVNLVLLRTLEYFT